jgi:glycosyltransferase involved in cell wall biosynthesis
MQFWRLTDNEATALSRTPGPPASNIPVAEVDGLSAERGLQNWETSGSLRLSQMIWWTQMNAPVSVIIPTYNRASLISETLDSIFAQSLPAAEVIVIDDGSTDNTSEIVSRFGDKVRYHIVENGGECRARNIGVSISNQPFVAFCDSDDVWLAHKLASQMELHNQRPDVEYSFTNFRTFTNDVFSDKTKFQTAPLDFQKILCAHEVGYTVSETPLYKDLLAFQPIWPSSLLMSRRFFDAVGGWKEELGRIPSVDLEFHLRCVRNAPIGILHEPLLSVRKHGGNFSGDTFKTTAGEIRILEYVAQNHGVDEKIGAIIQHQIYLRKADLCYGTFRAGSFDEYLRLSAELPPNYLDSKARLKQMICRLPRPLTKWVHRSVVE